MTYKNNLHKNAHPLLFEFAKGMRERGTEAEELLWYRIRGRQVMGMKFRREHPVDKYIADFYCHEKKLVIELDGGIHDNIEQQEADNERTMELNKLEIKVIRFRNEEVINNIDFVIEKIIEAAGKL